MALLLLSSIHDYFGLDYVAKKKVHRKYGMLKRIYMQMVDLSGKLSMHYSWNEWANAFVVQRVIQTELDYLCDHHSICCSHMRHCNLDSETGELIVQDAMRSWPAYRYDAMSRLDEEIQVQAKERIEQDFRRPCS